MGHFHLVWRIVSSKKSKTFAIWLTFEPSNIYLMSYSLFLYVLKISWRFRKLLSHLLENYSSSHQHQLPAKTFNRAVCFAFRNCTLHFWALQSTSIHQLYILEREGPYLWGKSIFWWILSPNMMRQSCCYKTIKLLFFFFSRFDRGLMRPQILLWVDICDVV